MAAPIVITVKSSPSKINALAKGLDVRGLRQATARAIKRTLVSGRASAIREMRSRKLISMSATTMKARITSHNHASPSDPTSSQFGEIRISGRQESLARFQAKKRVIGKSKLTGSSLYVVTVNALGTPYLVSGKAFMIQKGAGKDKIILARAGKGRLPVEKQYGPSLAEVADKTNATPIMVQRIAIRFDIEMQHELEFYTARAVQRANSTPSK